MVPNTRVRHLLFPIVSRLHSCNPADLERGHMSQDLRGITSLLILLKVCGLIFAIYPGYHVTSRHRNRME
jgi:hypothetical protein